MEILSEGLLTLRDLEAADYGLLCRWLCDPRVAEHYGGRDRDYTLETIREEYGRSEEDSRFLTRCIIERAKIPIGYLQFYATATDEPPSGKEPSLWLEPGTYNVDMFIGDPALWNQGIGSMLLEATARWLLESKVASVVTIDPKVINERAIRAYAKAGFRIVQRIVDWEWHEGQWHDSWLMRYEARVLR